MLDLPRPNKEKTTVVKFEKNLTQTLRLDTFFEAIYEIHFYSYTKMTILDYATFLKISLRG